MPRLDLTRALVLYPAEALDDDAAAVSPPVKATAQALVDAAREGLAGAAALAALTVRVDNAVYDPAAVDIDGGTIDGAAIGQDAPAAGAFTALTIGGEAVIAGGVPAHQVLPADFTPALTLPGNAAGTRRFTIPPAWRRYLALSPASAVHVTVSAAFTTPAGASGTGKLELVLDPAVIASATEALDPAAPVTVTASGHITSLGGADHLLLRLETQNVAPGGANISAGDFSLDIAAATGADPAGLLRIDSAALAADDLVAVHDTSAGELRAVTLGDLAAAVARLNGG